MGLDPGGALSHRGPERRHVLLQLAHNQVAAVETEVQEPLRGALRGQSGGFSLAVEVFRHKRPGRVLMVAVDVAEEDLPERDTMPSIAGRRRAVAEDDTVVTRPVPLILSEGDRLRETVGKPEMLPPNVVLVELQIQQEPMRNPDAVRREAARYLVRPRLHRGHVLIVEQQQGMDDDWGRHSQFLRILRSSAKPIRITGLQLSEGDVPAPARSAFDDRPLPRPVNPVA